MADVYTDRLGLIAQEEGTHDNEWGDLLNLNLQRLDAAVRGYTKITLAGAESLDANDITTTGSTAQEESFFHFIEFAGTAGTVTVPAENIMWIVYNNADANFTFQPSGGTGVTLTQGQVHFVIYGSNGTNFTDVTTLIGSKQLTDLSDVNTSTATNRNVLVADGVDWESRALDTADIQSGTLTDARVAESNVTQHEAALTILESQITDSTVLARVAANETISGDWTYTGRVVTDDSTTSRSGFNMGVGVAPTTPSDGDLWVTSSDIFARVGGTTLSLTDTAAGNPGGANTQIQFNDNGSFNGIAELTYNDTTKTIDYTQTLANAGITINHTGTNGIALDINANNASRTNTVIQLTQDHASSSAHVLTLKQDGTGNAIYANSTDTSAGAIARVYQNEISASSKILMELVQDATNATGVALRVQQDSSAAHIELDGTNGEGIKFTNAQASTDVNTLDDYEEGTWTPEIWDSSLSGAESQTYTDQVGLYTKIGRVVHLQGFLTLSSAGTLTGGDQAIIGNLPFTTNSSMSFPVSIASVGSTSGLTAGHNWTGLALANMSHILLYDWSGTGNPATVSLTITEIGTPSIYFQASYFV